LASHLRAHVTAETAEAAVILEAADRNTIDRICRESRGATHHCSAAGQGGVVQLAGSVRVSTMGDE
jgi:hypothetical protein